MKRSLSVAPSTSTSPVVVAKRAFSDGDAPTQDDETINLVYPFDWPSNTSNDVTGGTGGGGTSGSCNIPLDPSGPIIMTNLGLNVRTNPPITVIMGSLYLKFNKNDFSAFDGNLSMRCKPPIIRSVDGLSLSIGNGLTLSPDQSLILSTDPSSCLTTSNNGIGISIDSNTLVISDSHLTTHLDNTSCLSSSSNGIAINIDDSSFAIQDGKLYLKANPQYLSPYTICTIGLPSLSGSNYVSSNRSQLWNCQSYFYMVYSAGLVNVNSYIKVNSDNTDVTSSTSDKIVSFALVLTTSSIKIQNISGLTPISINPSSASLSLFNPFNLTKQASYVQIQNPSIAGTNVNWYFSHLSSGFKQISFVPHGNGVQFTQSTFGYGQISIIDSTGTSMEAIGISLEMNVAQTSKWYNSSATLTTGSITFSYQGQLPNGIQTNP